MSRIDRLGEAQDSAVSVQSVPCKGIRAAHSEAYARIMADDQIRPNSSEEFETNFSFSRMSYFRERGCVSVCDLRFVRGDALDDGLRRYNCLRPRRDWTSMAYLILGEASRDRFDHVGSGC